MRSLAAGLVLAFIVAGSAPATADEHRAQDHFTAEEIQRSQDYRSRAYPLSFAASGVSLLVIGLLGIGRGSRSLARWASRFRRRTTRIAALAVVVTVAPELASLSISVAAHLHARRSGLATDPPRAFLSDLGIATGFRYAIFLILAILILAIARRLPKMWGAVAAPVAAALTAFLVMVFPVIVEPAFNTFTEVDERTRARVERLADAAGVEIGDVLVADASRRTTALNAYVSGFGATRRVVLYDTLLDDSPARGVEAVVAHELAHVANGDVVRGTIIASGAVALGLIVAWWLFGRERLRRRVGATTPGDPAMIPFLSLFLTMALLITAPAANAFSRSIEARADRDAVAITGDPQAQVALHVRLARKNLSDLDPHPVIVWWFFTHPPTMERIRAATVAL